MQILIQGRAVPKHSFVKGLQLGKVLMARIFSFFATQNKKHKLKALISEDHTLISPFQKKRNTRNGNPFVEAKTNVRKAKAVLTNKPSSMILYNLGQDGEDVSLLQRQVLCALSMGTTLSTAKITQRARQGLVSHIIATYTLRALEGEGLLL